MIFYGYLICKPQIPFYPYIHCLAYFIISSFFYHFLPPFLSTSLVLAFLLSFPTFPLPLYSFLFVLLFYLLPLSSSQFLTPFLYSFFYFLSSSCFLLLLPSPHASSHLSFHSSHLSPYSFLHSFHVPSSYNPSPSFLLLSLLSYPLPTLFISTTMPLLLVLLLWITPANTEFQDGEGCPGNEE